MTRHLSTLSILHYVYGALQIFVGLVLAIIFFTVGSFMGSDAVITEEPAAGIAARFIQVFGGSMALLLLLWGLLVILSGMWLGQKRNRTGSIVIAALTCLSFPFGTALGIFTIVVLSSEDVKASYDQPTIGI